MPTLSYLYDILGPLVSPLPYHLLSLAGLLGTQLYQTFIITKIAYLVLPRSSFTTLQKRLFPIYFRTQSILILCTISTYPLAGGLPSIVNRRSDWVPLSVAGVTAALNWALYGPRTRSIMIERVHQATRDTSTAVSAKPDQSPDMKILNRKFSKAHAMSIHLNLTTLGATIGYLFSLASKVKLLDT